MKHWFKAVSVGLMVIGEFMDAVEEDGKISIKEILDIGIEAAHKAGFSVKDVEWDIFDEDDLKEFRGEYK